MSAKVYVLNDRGEPQKTPGWFSWRHRSNDEAIAARVLYLDHHGPEARRRKADERERRNVVSECTRCGLRHAIDRDCHGSAS